MDHIFAFGILILFLLIIFFVNLETFLPRRICLLRRQFCAFLIASLPSTFSATAKGHLDGLETVEQNGTY